MDFACLFWQKNPLYLLLIFCLGDFSCCSKGPNNLPVNSEYNQIHWYTIGLQKVFTQKGKFHFMSSSPLPLPQLAHYHFEGSGYLVLTGISFYFHSDHLGSLPPPLSSGTCHGSQVPGGFKTIYKVQHISSICSGKPAVKSQRVIFGFPQ